MIDWTSSYSAVWRAFVVNSATWADGEQIAGIASAQVTRDGTGDAPMLESGSITLDHAVGDDFGECYVRLAMTATQDGGAQRVDVCTLRCLSTGGNVHHGHDEMTLTGQSVLLPASKRSLWSCGRTYAPQGADGAEWAYGVLRDVLHAPVVLAGSFTLDDHVVFDAGDSVLKAVWAVLKAGNHVLSIAGNGTVTIQPLPTQPALSLDKAHAALLGTTMGHELDWSEVPNVYSVVVDEGEWSATNDDADSVTSTVSRGYVADVVDTAPTRVNGETYAQYAERMLAEQSTVLDTRTYTREWWPDVAPNSIVRGSMPSVLLDGDMRVQTQTLACGRGITVTEKSAREVRSWPTQ